MRAFKQKIRAMDKLAPKAINLFHFEKGLKQKTTFGGILTILLEVYVSYIVFS